MSKNIAFNWGRLDAPRFEAMHDAKTVEELVGRNVIKLLTAADGWRKHLNHWAGRRCLTTEVPHENLEIPYSSCEEDVYAKRIGERI